jgi:hypothetical protein
MDIADNIQERAYSKDFQNRQAASGYGHRQGKSKLKLKRIKK